MLEKLVESGKTGLKPITELFSVNAKAFEKLTSQQSAFIAEVLSDSFKQAQELAAKKDLTAIFESQKNYAESLQQKWVDNAKQTLELVNEARESATAVIESIFTKPEAPKAPVSKRAA
jgi:phasin family protein